METDNNIAQAELQKLKDEQQKVADQIREMKTNKATKDQLAPFLEKLKVAKLAVEKKEKELKPASDKVEFPREKFSQLLTQRFFLAPSFEIYGGVAGLFDLGPPGCAIKANLLALWRQHFILTENMLEVDCTSVTPRAVLTTSGHTAKFTDLMVKDVKTGACYRADHLLEGHLEKLLADKNITPQKVDELKLVKAQADTYDKLQMHEMLQKYNAKAPDTNNDLSFPEPFNLMFQTQIGPTGTNEGFLRPETAQGIFVNFKRLLEFNGGKLPFAGAQIGQAFRNEIAPRSGLLRVREFTLAEIEHFVNPGDKSHPKFKTISDLTLTLFPREDQVDSQKTREMTLGDAVKNGVIANETLGYFIGRTYLFLLQCGIKRDRLRFRQHLKDEMAHYACDCWDAEIQNSYGWVECVGIADRACFDLSAHATETKTPLSAFIEYSDGARTVKTLVPVLNKPQIGQTFKGKGQAQKIITHLDNLEFQTASKLKSDLANGPVTLTVGGEQFEVTSAMVKEWKEGTKTVTGEQVTPGVIEPSFGIGRILYSILEHSYYTRTEDEQRNVLALPAVIAPVKVSVLPLINNNQLLDFVPSISNILNESNISYKVDAIGQTVGKRYARTDEIGIPFGITIDFDTVKDNTVTLRERDSTNQVRVNINDLATVLRRLINGHTKWDDVWNTYPHVEKKEE